VKPKQIMINRRSFLGGLIAATAMAASVTLGLKVKLSPPRQRVMGAAEFFEADAARIMGAINAKWEQRGFKFGHLLNGEPLPEGAGFNWTTAQIKSNTVTV
jgi:hypothetical protein